MSWSTQAPAPSLKPTPSARTAERAMDDDTLGPISRLFVDSLPGESALQMCFMRPEPDELCPELPFLVPPPTLRSLRDCGLEPTVVSAVDVLAVGPPAASDMSTSAQPEPLSADEEAKAKAMVVEKLGGSPRSTLLDPMPTGMLKKE